MLRLLAPALLLSMMLPVSAEAATYCFEDLGNTGCPWKETFPKSQLRRLSCQNLWYVRNSIYDRKGYCFKKQDGKDVFDNSDCTVRNPSNIRFNANEWNNITNIRQVESNKGCTP